jgi:hypothetical protein
MGIEPTQVDWDDQSKGNFRACPDGPVMADFRLSQMSFCQSMQHGPT